MHYNPEWLPLVSHIRVEAPELSHAVSVSSLGVAGITIVTIHGPRSHAVTSLVDRRFSVLESSEERLRLIINAAMDAVITMKRGRPDHKLGTRRPKKLSAGLLRRSLAVVFPRSSCRKGIARITTVASNGFWKRVRE